MTSNFAFLEAEFPILFNLGTAAEFNLHQDPNTSLYKIRLFGEKITEILFDEHALEFPAENSFHNRLKTLTYERILPFAIKDLFFQIKNKGNSAVHSGTGTVEEATQGLSATYKVAKWFYETYSEENQDLSGVVFQEPANLDARHALHLLETEYKKLEEKLADLLQERETSGLSEEKQQAIQQRSERAARKVEMSEAETRQLIDEQLRLAGWEVDTPVLNYKKNRSLPQKGKNRAIAEWPVGSLWADYALFVGTELFGIVEAKRYAQDISTDLGQSKIYAEQVQPVHGSTLLGEWGRHKVPFLFSTNGRPYLEQIKTKSGIWFLDVREKTNLARSLQGWYSPQGLVKLREQDVEQANQKLSTTPLDFLESRSGLGLRKYQIKAIQAVENKIIQQPHDRRALIAMATGTGKTRTIIGLCYHLIQTNRFSRILFLVDRSLLGTQAFDAFKDNKIVDLSTFAEIYDIKGMKAPLPDTDTRLQFATVQSMVKRLYYNDNEETIPTVDQYDCIIIDEAHRGYLLDKEMDEEELNFKNQQDYVSKYRMVLDYFDAYAIALTATPALHTTEIFGKPVYTYSYREAVIDGYLIDHEPPYLIRTQLSEEGIVWERGEKPKAYDPEGNAIVELDELEDELHFDVTNFNKQVLNESFNQTVVKQLVQELDPDGDEKVLIFAATDAHADKVVYYLKEEFHNNGIEVPDDAIQKITGKSYNPQEQVRRYKNEKYPTIAVTVDLLSTGVDVPAICTIVFLRRIRSRILYEQMMGRATRRCDEIGKETFRIYDAVRLYETLEDFTQMKPVVANPATTFQQLTEELPGIDSQERAQVQLEQIIAKLQRRQRKMSSHHVELFKYHAGGLAPDEWIRKLRESPVTEGIKRVTQAGSLWSFLDESKLASTPQYVSEHVDGLLGMETGYGKGKKPADYLNDFTEFIRNNRNQLAALNILFTRPAELNRSSLKELLIALAQGGYDQTSVKVAWREAKQQDVGADIISIIRTLAIGSVLESHDVRIRRAVDQVRALRPWNKTQQRWLDRFEKQLLAETVLQVEDLNEEPFKEAGGFQQLNKVFNNELEGIIRQINHNLYQTA